MMPETRTPREEFDLYLHNIKKGEFISTSEKVARELAQQHGFPLNEVDEALPIGYRAKFDNYLALIKSGEISTFDILEAKKYAQQHGFPLKEVDGSELIGARVRFDRYLELIKKDQTKFIDFAYSLACEYGFPTQELDTAVESLRRRETQRRLAYGKS